jgi:ribosomal protein L37E
MTIGKYNKGKKYGCKRCGEKFRLKATLCAHKNQCRFRNNKREKP